MADQRPPRRDDSPEDELLNLLARLIARRFQKRRAFLLREQQAGPDAVPPNSSSPADAEQESE